MVLLVLVSSPERMDRIEVLAMSLLDLPLSHFSSEPAITMYERKNDGTFMDGMKPAGLWVSVDGEYDWPSWCLAENFSRGDDLRFQHKVILQPDHRVLHLDTAVGLRWLTAKYQFDDPRYRVLTHHTSFVLDWPKLSQDHDGLVIAPYLWDCRLDNDVFWYYGWDCASGCIWNPRSVASIEMVRRTDLPDVIRAARAKSEAETDALWEQHPPRDDQERDLRDRLRKMRHR